MAYYNVTTIESTYIYLYISPDTDYTQYRVFVRPSSSTSAIFDQIYTITEGQYVYVGGLTGGVNYTVNVGGYNASAATTSWIGAQTFTTPGAVTYYTATLYFDANGGSGAPSSVSATNTADTIQVTIPTTVPYKSGATFLGWSTYSGAGSASFQPGYSYYFTAGMHTLYAVWSQVYYYTIIYDANGGTGGPGTVTATQMYADAAFTIPSTVPTRNGYTFLGWSYSSTATSATFLVGDSYYFSSGTTTLYAVWTKATGGGGAHMHTGESWKTAKAWVHNGTEWKEAKPWVHNGTTWKETTG